MEESATIGGDCEQYKYFTIQRSVTHDTNNESCLTTRQRLTVALGTWTTVPVTNEDLLLQHFVAANAFLYRRRKCTFRRDPNLLAALHILSCQSLRQLLSFQVLVVLNGEFDVTK